ncbi:MAG: protein phosphatase 2C domain-containing protein [Planctomycetota bacterium]
MANPRIKLEQAVGGLHCVAASDVGMRRASNQDSLAVSLAENSGNWESHGHLMLVADGMGAHAAGELASQMASDAIPLSYRKQPAESASEAIIGAVKSANGTIYAKGQNTIDFQGMGTTCSCLLLLPCGALAAHVGDSRIYRLRCDHFEQLTFDHSLVWEMAKEGQATEEEVPAYVPKNVITRSLGPHPTVAVDVEGPFPLADGDRYLLCSDGLTGPLKPELIGMVLSSLPLSDVAQTLVDLANLRGGPDNITVIVAEIVKVAHLGTNESSTSRTMPKYKRTAANGHGNQSWFDSVMNAVTFGSWGKQRCAKIGQQKIGLQGKAPYRRHLATPDSTSIETLTDIVRQLEDLEDQRQWPFDWNDIRTDRHQAHQAIAKGEHTAAVVHYCSAVRRLMQALRDSPPAPPSDSGIHLG